MKKKIGFASLLVLIGLCGYVAGVQAVPIPIGTTGFPDVGIDANMLGIPVDSPVIDKEISGLFPSAYLPGTVNDLNTPGYRSSSVVVAKRLNAHPSLNASTFVSAVDSQLAVSLFNLTLGQKSVFPSSAKFNLLLPNNSDPSGFLLVVASIMGWAGYTLKNRNESLNEE